MKNALIIFLILFTQNLFAKKIDGTIVHNDDSKEEVTLMVVYGAGAIAPKNTRVISCINKKGVKKTYKPGEIKEYIFEHKGKTVRMVSHLYPNVLVKDHVVFLKMVVDGNLKLMSYISNGDAGGQILYDGETFYEPYIKGHLLGLVRRSYINLDDCPKLIKECEKRNLKIKDKNLIEIVKIYNEVCY